MSSVVERLGDRAADRGRGARWDPNAARGADPQGRRGRGRDPEAQDDEPEADEEHWEPEDVNGAEDAEEEYDEDLEMEPEEEEEVPDRS